ncbi:hypothetical protein EC973_000362 [Apophysomyces ossiformis]|uniref:RNA helicase n=1 Tax=Apophysomyces ossiformis TaxID=679940 RepID=A0A8H7EN60_9FUNG|nr:hypothetical protein EC973_000362 [Apophysomyces ossiformis]
MLARQVPQCKMQDIIASYNESKDIAAMDRILLAGFYGFADPYLPKSVRQRLDTLRKISDLRYPNEWFPQARKMQRTIFLHVGPTNSGKTYEALERLKEAHSGLYCGPLRLLAHEIFEKMNAEGIACNLLTGEEKRDVSPDARLTSSTVEMASVDKPVEVAVIDEIQMISDPQRGWAWTQAFLGLQAKEIHLCGEASVLPLIKSIGSALGEQVLVREYERLTPLKVANHSLKEDYTKMEKGDCVVSFSRSMIFAIKKRIEEETNLRCAVVYGALPPETRALQVKSFNEPNGGLDVLVASDAIGMGLNLCVKRMIFSSVKKYNGSTIEHIPVPQVKQIAGRSGRFGTLYDSGTVTTMCEQDLAYVKQSMQAPIQYLKLAGLQPPIRILELFSQQLKGASYSSLLEKFEEIASVGNSFFLCNVKEQKKIADAIEHIDIPLRHRHQFVVAPVDTDDEMCVEAIEYLASSFSKRNRCSITDVVQLPETVTDEKALRYLESSHKVIILYMWLSLRYPEVFVTNSDDAVQMKTRCEHLIDQTLRNPALEMVSKKGVKRRPPRLDPVLDILQDGAPNLKRRQ